MLFRLVLCVSLIFSTCFKGIAQVDTSRYEEDLLSLLDANAPEKKKDYTAYTFKGVRVINGQSVENEAKGVLNFIILHRFGTVQNAFQDLFGLDRATTRLGLEYGVTDWFTVGVGRSSFQREYDGYIRTRILRQTTDDKMPLSLSYAGTMMVRTDEVQLPDPTQKYYFSNRLSFCNQLLIARKFSDRFSLQLTPSHVHFNLVKNSSDPNDIFALGVGGRIKITKRFALTGEWFYTLPDARLNSQKYYNSLSFGVDIETGGHVFQLHFTNSTGMSERTFIAQTTDDWSNKGVHFGFNISRVFTIVKPKEFRN